MERTLGERLGVDQADAVPGVDQPVEGEEGEGDGFEGHGGGQEGDDRVETLPLLAGGVDPVELQRRGGGPDDEKERAGGQNALVLTGKVARALRRRSVSAAPAPRPRRQHAHLVVE